MRSAETLVRGATNEQIRGLRVQLIGEQFKSVAVIPGAILGKPEIEQIELLADSEGNTVFVSQTKGETPPVIVTRQSLQPLIETALERQA